MKNGQFYDAKVKVKGFIKLREGWIIQNTSILPSPSELMEITSKLIKPYVSIPIIRRLTARLFEYEEVTSETSVHKIDAKPYKVEIKVYYKEI